MIELGDRYAAESSIDPYEKWLSRAIPDSASDGEAMLQYEILDQVLESLSKRP